VRVGVATIQRGRHRHLERQVAGGAAQTRPPDDDGVLSMDPPPRHGDGTADPAVLGAGGLGREGDGPGAALRPASAPGGGAAPPPARASGPRVLAHPVPDGAPIPLAAARNLAIAALGDVDVAILLDTDCIPGPDLVARYADAAARRTGLLAGPVGHLPAGRPAGTALLAADREAAVVRGSRPVPADDELLGEPRHELFWSLSFAVSPATHELIGGFDEGYVGYGGEDTDYALRAREADVGLTWVGGAWAYHQDHPVSNPPREHLRDIVRNARRFHAHWGRWPMEGWLGAFADEGLVRWAPGGGRLELVQDGAA
jgi:hypothetical protein